MTGQWRVGDWIDGRFEIYDIHAGGMGLVFVAYDHHGPPSRSVVALKTLRDEFLYDERQTGRFISECNTWITLERHPHIVRAYSVQVIEDKPYVLMELVTGGDLRNWIGTLRLDLAQILRFGVQFCLGMEYAVQKGLHCHRDIKPENLLITAGGTLKVTDFGLAKVRDERGSARHAEPIPLDDVVEVEVVEATEDHLRNGGTPADKPMSPAAHPGEPLPARGNGRVETSETGRLLSTIDWPIGLNFRETVSLQRAASPRSNGARPSSERDPLLDRPVRNLTESDELLGTAPYSAPEQFRRAKAVDFRADIYSFGVVLFEMLTSQRPFRGGTIGKLKQQHLHEPPPSVVSWIPTRHRRVARKIDQIVQRCLEKVPEKRYGSFGELRVALSRCLWKVSGERVSIPTETEMEAWELTGKGVSLGTLGRFDEELTCYAQAIRARSSYVPAWFNQAAALGVLGRWSEAKESAEHARKLNPRSIPALLNLAMAWHVLGQSDEARSCIDEALELQPRDPDAWYCLGLVLWERGDFAGARAALAHTMQLRPASTEALVALNAVASRRPARLQADAQTTAPAAPPVHFVRRIEDTTGEAQHTGWRRWGFFR